MRGAESAPSPPGKIGLSKEKKRKDPTFKKISDQWKEWKNGDRTTLLPLYDCSTSRNKYRGPPVI